MRLFSLAFASFLFFFSSFAFAQDCSPLVLDEGTMYQALEIRGDLNGEIGDISACELQNLVAVIVGVVMTATDLAALVKARPQIAEDLAEAEAFLLHLLTRTGMPLSVAIAARVPLPGASSWTIQDIDSRLYFLLFWVKNFQPQYFCGLVYYILPEANSETLSSQEFVLTPETIREGLVNTLFSRGLLSPEDIEVSCGPPLL